MEVEVDVSFKKYLGKNNTYNMATINEEKLDYLNSRLVKDEFLIYFARNVNRESDTKENCINLINVYFADNSGLSALLAFRKLCLNNRYGNPYLVVKKGGYVERMIKHSIWPDFNIVNSLDEL